MRSLLLHSNRARALLAEGLGSEPPRLDLAACAVAALEDEAIDVSRVLHTFDALGARVSALEPSRLDALGRAQALRRVLADEEGFWGDTDTYDAPENSFLDRVLARKKGLPITLAVVYLEVARRAGVPLFGVSFPGHFLVACPSEERSSPRPGVRTSWRRWRRRSVSSPGCSRRRRRRSSSGACSST